MKKYNEYIEYEDFYEIILYYPNTYNKIDSAYISKIDYDKCVKIFWRLSDMGYARGYNKITKEEIFLHKYILQSSNNELIDHKNRNKLDCRRFNLHIADKQLNSINRNTPKNSTTNYTGVSYDNRRKKYRSYIKYNQKQFFLGYFEELTNAIIARLLAELKYFGEEYAPQRHLFKEYLGENYNE
jgi:hypothetical protein